MCETGTAEFARFDHLPLFDHNSSPDGNILDLTTVLNRLDRKLGLIKVSESFLNRGVNGGCHKMAYKEVRNGGTAEFAHFDHLPL